MVPGFDGGAITSNAGALVLGDTDRGNQAGRAIRLVFSRRAALAADPAWGSHAGEAADFEIALGYEDLASRPRILLVFKLRSASRHHASHKRQLNAAPN